MTRLALQDVEEEDVANSRSYDAYVLGDVTEDLALCIKRMPF